MAHFVHYRSGPTFGVHCADFCCCWISVDCSCSRDLLLETKKNRSEKQAINAYVEKCIGFNAYV